MPIENAEDDVQPVDGGAPHINPACAYPLYLDTSQEDTLSQRRPVRARLTQQRRREAR